MTKRKIGAAARALAEPTRAEEKAAAEHVADEKKETIVFSFRVSPEFKKQFQLWCVSHDKTQSKALEDAFRLLVREYGD